MSACDLQPSPDPIRIGADGFAMLALSTALMVLSGGATLLASLAYVLWTACRTRCDTPERQQILVLGMRLNALGEPSPDYQRRLLRAATLHASGGAAEADLCAVHPRRGALRRPMRGGDMDVVAGIHSALLRFRRPCSYRGLMKIRMQTAAIVAGQY